MRTHRRTNSSSVADPAEAGDPRLGVARDRQRLLERPRLAGAAEAAQGDGPGSEHAAVAAAAGERRDRLLGAREIGPGGGGRAVEAAEQLVALAEPAVHVAIRGA